MPYQERNGYLKDTTLQFAKNVAQSIADMAGAEFALFQDTFRETPFSTLFRSAGNPREIGIFGTHR
jgi:hypothetical protein